MVLVCDVGARMDVSVVVVLRFWGAFGVMKAADGRRGDADEDPLEEDDELSGYSKHSETKMRRAAQVVIQKNV